MVSRRDLPFVPQNPRLKPRNTAQSRTKTQGYKVAWALGGESCVPSAVMSNYLTKSIKGNVALSISLTAVCSLLSFITIPITLGIGLNLINSSEELNLLTLRNTSLKIFLMVAIPTIIGVFVKTYLNWLVNKLNKVFDFSSFLLFLLIVFSAAYVEKDILVNMMSIIIQ